MTNSDMYSQIKWLHNTKFLVLYRLNVVFCCKYYKHCKRNSLKEHATTRLVMKGLATKGIDTRGPYCQKTLLPKEDAIANALVAKTCSIIYDGGKTQDGKNKQHENQEIKPLSLT